MTAIYDLEYVDNLDKYCSAYKIGSGDITWKDILLKIAKKNKPIFLATGASDMKDVEKVREQVACRMKRQGMTRTIVCAAASVTSGFSNRIVFSMRSSMSIVMVICILSLSSK